MRARPPPRCSAASAWASGCGTTRKVLSGGEQQRVALARAFVVRPAVLLADEPTGSLDFATGEHVMELMFELNREAGTTLVLVTHDRGIAARCDRQLHIEAGPARVREPTKAARGAAERPSGELTVALNLKSVLAWLAQLVLVLLQLLLRQALLDLRLDVVERAGTAPRACLRA